MPNPILPLWEHIPDGEPRVFGDRVYLYGSHDRPLSDSFCDHRLKVWSASVRDPDHWRCHGDAFLCRREGERASDVSWYENGMLYAPDAVKIGEKYYLFVYLFYGRGCVAVSDRPEGPFREAHPYQWGDSADFPPGACEGGVLVDPGVLVDGDGRVYVYGGFERSWAVEVERDAPWKVIPESWRADILPAEAPFRFYEAASPRKIGDTYYLVYSPRTGSQLVYATASSPMGPFTYRGVIVDNGVDYPGGNNHGGLAEINGQWYIFYHRTTNGNVFSRQACAERVDILPDDTIPQVEMTSLGFSESLNPYEATPAHRACVLRGGDIKYLSPLDTMAAHLRKGSVLGFRYFDFGRDDAGTPMTLVMDAQEMGESGVVRVLLDDPDRGEEIAALPFGGGSGTLRCGVPCVTGRHALYFVLDDPRNPPAWAQQDRNRELLRIRRFVFTK